MDCQIGFSLCCTMTTTTTSLNQLVCNLYGNSNFDRETKLKWYRTHWQSQKCTSQVLYTLHILSLNSSPIKNRCWISLLNCTYLLLDLNGWLTNLTFKSTITQRGSLLILIAKIAFQPKRLLLSSS